MMGNDDGAGASRDEQRIDAEALREVESCMRSAYLLTGQAEARSRRGTAKDDAYVDDVLLPQLDDIAALLRGNEHAWPASWRETLVTWCRSSARQHLPGVGARIADRHAHERAMDTFGVLLGIPGAQATLDRTDRERALELARLEDYASDARTHAELLVTMFLRPGGLTAQIAVEAAFGDLSACQPSKLRDEMQRALKRTGVAMVFRSLALDGDDALQAPLHAMGSSLCDVGHHQDVPSLVAAALELQRRLRCVADVLEEEKVTHH